MTRLFEWNEIMFVDWMVLPKLLNCAEYLR